MKFNADDYREAAEEHVETARLLHGAGRYAMAHTTAGLAVESILRAYRLRIDPQFDARHDLGQLAVLAKFTEMLWALEPAARQRAVEAFDVVSDRWSNTLRFASQRTLLRHLKSVGVDKGLRGDAAKESSRRIVASAAILVDIGVRQWKRHTSV